MANIIYNSCKSDFIDDSNNNKSSNNKNKFSKKNILQTLLSIKVFYNASASIVGQNKYLKPNAILAGFFQKQTNSYSSQNPQEETILAFLATHKKVLLLTFGSMVSTNAIKTTKKFLSILEEYNIATIIATGAGALEQPKDYDNKNILFVKSLDYDRFLPKIYAIIHHGGAGTTQNSIANGCANMAITHAVDQPIWGTVIYKLGVGPKGTAIYKLTKSKLRKKIFDLYNNKSYKEKATSISQKIKDEYQSDKQELYDFIQQPLPPA